MNHDWQFLAAPGGASNGFSPIVVIVCSRCGAIRAEEAPRGPGDERRIDVAGDCPGDDRASRYGTPRSAER